MSFLSRKETYDSNTPSDLSSHRSPKGTTIQSDRGFTSNSSVHTTSPATTCGDLFDYTEQNPGGDPSISQLKSFHFLEKSTFRFSNQSQSTSEAGSVRNSIVFSTPTPEIRSLNIPSFEDEDGFSNDVLLKASAPAFPDPGEARARKARVLESKVARMASKTCSVEEVSALQKEVDRWLTEVSAADGSTALFLSSLLLKAILSNHVAYSDASKNAEATFKLKVGELEQEIEEKSRLEVELRKKYDEAIEKTRLFRETLILLRSISERHQADLRYLRSPEGSRLARQRFFEPMIKGKSQDDTLAPVKPIIDHSVEGEDHYFKPRSQSPDEGEHTPVEYPPPLATPASEPVVIESSVARLYDMAAMETSASLPHPTPTAYNNRRHEKEEKENLRELSQNNSSGGTGRLPLSPIRSLQESDDEAERERSNRRQQLNEISADASTSQSDTSPPPTPPPPPPSAPLRRPTAISRASTAAEEVEREREPRRKQSNESHGPETPVLSVPPPPPPPPPQNHTRPSTLSPEDATHAHGVEEGMRRSATERRPSIAKPQLHRSPPEA